VFLTSLVIGAVQAAGEYDPAERGGGAAALQRDGGRRSRAAGAAGRAELVHASGAGAQCPHIRPQLCGCPVFFLAAPPVSQLLPGQ
jgi:hypothetical protein